MSGTRKLAAILAADVVGYSRLMGEDEAGTALSVREHREAAAPIVREFGGRLVKTMGDGVLIEFPSVVAAVECAILIQKQMAERNAGVPVPKRILYRIGVNLGDVLIEGDDILGEGVNIAARLEGACEPGGVLISGAAYDHVRGRIEANFVDRGEKSLKNIARPVRAYSVEAGAPAPPTRSAAPNRRATAALLAGLGIVALAAGAWYWLANRPAALSATAPAPAASTAAAPAHLSLVVLPFKNLSGDSSQDYFADGITENLTTDLSRIRGSFVIARNTAFTYKGKNLDAKQIGKELGVRYVLEGSVQREGTRVRVNAQLIDAETGAHLWADRFEEDVADLFKLQDQVVARLTNSLGYELVKTEAEKSARSKNPDAVDLAMRGWALMWQEQLQQRTRENNNSAKALFEQALKIDPNETDALAGDAYANFVEYSRGWETAGTDYEAKILGQADRAIALAPDNEWAHYAKSLYLTNSGRANEGLSAAVAGLAVKPDDAPLIRARGAAEIVLGRYQQAISDVQQAMRLSPHDPRIGLWLDDLGNAELGLGHFDAAVDKYHEVIDAGWRAFQPYRGLAAAYALEGKMEEAASALAEARRLNPQLSLKWLRAHLASTPPLMEGLRKAGLPEDAPAEPAHLSLVVLPFTNLSGDPAQDYFADGITENLTTDLSRIRGSFVIARNTAFTYKGKNVDAKEIGRELGVRYVLEGSVQREGTRVRVNAQLIDAETGAHLWADRFDEDVADLFKLQDEVVARLANTLGFELVKAEAEKAARSKNPDAVDLTMRGWALARPGVSQFSKEKNDAARALFEQALKIDPDNADALAGEAYTYANEYSLVRNNEADYDPKILDPADRAISLAPNTLWAYYVKCVYLYYSHRADKAIEAADAGLAINPNFGSLWAVRGNANLFSGRFEEARSDILQSMRLSPRDPLKGIGAKYLGDAELGLGQFDAAIDDYHKAIDLGFHYMWPYASLAAAYALSGKIDEAKVALAEAQRLEPKLTSVKYLMPLAPPVPNLYEGLRKAGLPEDARAEAVHLSLVVLPFTNLSGDPAQDYFADGITENLTTDLSRIRGSFVIARNTAFTYKGKNVDAKEIGKELGVRYVLEGSVQREGTRVRVNAQLIDAETGAHLWADRFEEDVADLFKLQDQVVARLGNALGFELVKAEAKKSAGSNNPDATDLAMRGWATMWQSYPQPPKEKRDSHYAALALFESALKIDPNNAEALAGSAFTNMALYVFGEATSEVNFDAKTIDPADRAIALAPDDMRAYTAKCFYLAVTGRANEALHAADAGLAINPNSSPLLAGRSFAETILGRFEQAKSDTEQAMRLSPRDPELPNRLINLGMIEIGLGHFDAAAGEFQNAIDAGAHYFIPYVGLASAYALAGKAEDAKVALAEARRLNPDLTVKWLTRHAPAVPPLFEGLRKAGLPEE
jgi:TolB-like protein/class 3 adenylate cyclase/Flp pilus assembly protein TadD